MQTVFPRLWFLRIKNCLVLMFVYLTILACGGTVPASQTTAPGYANESSNPGDQIRVINFAGLERTYVLHIPPGYNPAKPAPLVLAFHGIGLDANEMMRISGLNTQADKSGFIVVYPNGSGATKSWNGGRCCGEAAKNNVDDVGFVRALIDELAGSLNIDQDRVYATGFSNGAILVYRLACELSDRIAAIGPVAATQIRDDQEVCHPSRNISVIHFHGTADRLNPYEGGTTSVGYEFLPVSEAIGFWVNQNACPTPIRSEVTDSIQHDEYVPCIDNSAVELYTIMEGEHAWPGGQAVSVQVGEPTMELSATPLMWEFFKAHSLP